MNNIIDAFDGVSITHFCNFRSSCRHFFHRELQRISPRVMKSEQDAVIVSYARTPIGSFTGILSELSATSLGSTAIKGALAKLSDKMKPEEIGSVVLGHVLTGGCGQASARQAAVGAGIPMDVPSYSVDKVCASGMRAVAIAAMSIQSGQEDICVAGGMESMSRVPFHLDSMRGGKKMGHDQIVDGLIRDGLWDVYNNEHMGSCTERVNEKFGITRDALDAYAIETNRRAREAYANGLFADEIVPVTTSKGVVSVDEQVDRVKPEKLPALKPSFKTGGCITPGNASPISDGAAALVLTSRAVAARKGLRPIARVVASADAARDPADFTIAPALAVEKLLAKTSLQVKDIGVWEFNEAFATVVLANAIILGQDKINMKDVNILGGALSLGHPLGCSGARIICTLITAMNLRGVRYGCAAICNGGGGASAILIELEDRNTSSL
jgi:acetyl-CoA C-acetyltransferase